VKLFDGIPVWGDPVDEGALTQIRVSARTAVWAAMMADHHKGYAVPIGGVLAYDNAISPSGVGYDIACGNKAVKTDFRASETRVAWAMDRIAEKISFGIGRKNAERVDHDLFDDPAWQIPVIATLRDKAAVQLGTVGSGNHYVDLFEDEEGWLWIGVHFGSRGFGHSIATYYLKAGGADNGMDAEPLVLRTDTDLGQEYLEGMRLAGRYAYAGRDWVCSKVADILQAGIVEEVHNHHNYAWKEVHAGLGEVWVVRKGATPAFTGQRGFVGGSMGDSAVIIEGADGTKFPTEAVYEEQKQSLFSTVHGAGRVMSRTDATGRNRKGKQIRPPRITREEMDAWVNGRGVVLRGAAEDEAPQAYKRLPEVLAHHAATIRILHTLRPIGVAMAGANEYDPYKD
jgi:tRNA-splicing ligase RtcB